jgi:hypothetical protein
MAHMRRVATILEHTQISRRSSNHSIELTYSTTWVSTGKIIKGMTNHSGSMNGGSMELASARSTQSVIPTTSLLKKLWTILIKQPRCFGDSTPTRYVLCSASCRVSRGNQCQDADLIIDSRRCRDHTKQFYDLHFCRYRSCNLLSIRIPSHYRLPIRSIERGLVSLQRCGQCPKWPIYSH